MALAANLNRIGMTCETTYLLESIQEQAEALEELFYSRADSNEFIECHFKLFIANLRLFILLFTATRNPFSVYLLSKCRPRVPSRKSFSISPHNS